MLSIDRWRKWQPSSKKVDDSPGIEPSKPSIPTFEGFVGSIPGKTQNFDGPTAGVQDLRVIHFNRWLTERCVRSDRLFSPVGDLQIDFSVWLSNQGGKHFTRSEFESLLNDAEYIVADGLASGLMLYGDLHGDIYERLERLAIQAESGVNKQPRGVDGGAGTVLCVAEASPYQRDDFASTAADGTNAPSTSVHICRVCERAAAGKEAQVRHKADCSLAKMQRAQKTLREAIINRELQRASTRIGAHVRVKAKLGAAA